MFSASLNGWMKEDARAAALTRIYPQKEVVGKITAGVAASRLSMLFAMEKAKCAWRGVGTSIVMTIRSTMASYLCPVSALAVIVTVSTQNT